MFIGLIIFVFGYVTFYWGETHFGHQCRYTFWDLLGISAIFSQVGSGIPGSAPFTFGQGEPLESWMTLPGCAGKSQAIPQKPGYGPATPQAPCGTWQGKPIQNAPPISQM